MVIANLTSVTYDPTVRITLFLLPLALSLLRSAFLELFFSLASPWCSKLRKILWWLLWLTALRLTWHNLKSHTTFSCNSWLCTAKNLLRTAAPLRALLLRGVRSFVFFDNFFFADPDLGCVVEPSACASRLARSFLRSLVPICISLLSRMTKYLGSHLWIPRSSRNL